MISVKGLDHHLLNPKQCCMNGVVIHEVPKFLQHQFLVRLCMSYRLWTPSRQKHWNIIPLQLTKVTSYFDDIQHQLHVSSPEFSIKEAWGQLLINSVPSYVYDAVDGMDNYNFATVLERFIIISSLQTSKLNFEKWQMLRHLVLAKKWAISPKKTLNTIHHTTQHDFHTVLHPSLSQWFKTNDHQLRYRRLPHNM